MAARARLVCRVCAAEPDDTEDGRSIEGADSDGGPRQHETRADSSAGSKARRDWGPGFGSMARGDAGPQSDIDLLVEVGPNPSPWFPGGLIAGLEGLLGRRVQVVTERGLDDLLRDRVLEEAIRL
jgi:predicted nucleotidyltransferase